MNANFVNEHEENDKVGKEDRDEHTDEERVCGLEKQINLQKAASHLSLLSHRIELHIDADEVRNNRLRWYILVDQLCVSYLIKQIEAANDLEIVESLGKELK